jgi:CheY-like chemotaxis protein/Tfp pilus assembly protein PilF
MRLEFEPNSSALPFVENEVVNQNTSSEVERMLRDGIKAAQEGKRAEARNLLLGVTESDADNENAWLWLASISEYPEELLVFLNNVLRINPQNERALEWHKATNSLLAKTLVQRGVEAANENRKEFARQCFEQALEHEAENEMAWLWMASVCDGEVEKTACFEKVLSINAENETAKNSLQSMQSEKTQKMFQEALAAAFDGNHTDAKEMLENVLSRDAELEDAWVLKSHLACSFEERAECFLKLSVLNPENEMARTSLASWRMLSDKRAARNPEEVSEFAAGALSEKTSDETAPAEFSDFSAGETFAATESEQAEEFSAEPETENQLPAFSEQETFYFNQPSSAESAEFAAENSSAEEFAQSDAAMPDLSFDSNYRAPESISFDDQESEKNQFAEAEEQEKSYDEFQMEKVRYDSDELPQTAPELPAPQPDLAAELEAEEAEMNLAFSNSRENKEAVDYFQNFDESDDIHKTQQANYEAEDYYSQNFASEEQPAETFAETDAEQVDATKTEEWRDTSPSVFVNYSSASDNSSEANTIKFSVAENSDAPETPVKIYVEEAVAAENPEQSFLSEEPVQIVEEQVSLHPEEPVEPQTEEKSSPPKAETVLCPFCDAVNEKQAFSCSACQTVLTLSDLEMLLASQTANPEKLQQSVESLERENESFGLNAEQLTNLGVGHINLKNHRQGFLYLQEAVRMNPSNVLLDAQVNALAIRLSEMEEQQSAHDLLPKNRKILVVDDSPTVRKLISGKLEKCGHEVICAVDGVDALEKINELKPDLVLLDITMPRMDGYQVCKLIRNNEATKDVPVVMISGKDGFFDKVRGRMAGTSGYITKPFGPETLMKTVETYLN